MELKPEPLRNDITVTSYWLAYRRVLFGTLSIIVTLNVDTVAMVTADPLTSRSSHPGILESPWQGITRPDLLYVSAITDFSEAIPSAVS